MNGRKPNKGNSGATPPHVTRLLQRKKQLTGVLTSIAISRADIGKGGERRAHSQKSSKRGNKLHGHSNVHVVNSRASALGNGPFPSGLVVKGSKPSGKKILYLDSESGKPVAAVTRHTTHASYKAAIDKSSAPLTNGSTFHGSPAHELEYMRKGQRHIKTTGRQLLGVIGTHLLVPTSVPPGGRYLVIPLSPSWLGGRAELFAQQFQQHKVTKLRLIYEPLVPATTKGSVVMYFIDDIAQDIQDTGRSELVHASTYDHFVEFPVWESCVLEIDPAAALKRYFDAESQDERLSSQGLIVVSSGSGQLLDTAERIGHVYLEFEIDFFEDAIDRRVPMAVDVQFNMNADATLAPPAGDPVACGVYTKSTGLGANITGWIGFDGIAASSLLDLENYVLCVRVTGVPGQWATKPWRTSDNSDRRNFALGQCFFVRFMYDDDNNTAVAVLYANLDAASIGPQRGKSNGVDVLTVGDGAVLWGNNDPLNDTFAMTMEGTRAILVK